MTQLNEKTKVRVYKNGVECGWYKDIIPGQNAIIATCKLRGYDITQYEFRDFEDDTKVLWIGAQADI